MARNNNPAYSLFVAINVMFAAAGIRPTVTFQSTNDLRLFVSNPAMRNILRNFSIQAMMNKHLKALQANT